MDKSTLYTRAFLQVARKSQDEATLRNFVRRFIALLEKRRHVYLLPRIFSSVEKILAEEKGTLATSRFALAPASREKLVVFLKKTFGDFHENQLAYNTNEDMLGGVSVRHKDFLYDATLDTAVAKLEQVWK